MYSNISDYINKQEDKLKEILNQWDSLIKNMNIDYEENLHQQLAVIEQIQINSGKEIENIIIETDAELRPCAVKHQEWPMFKKTGAFMGECLKVVDHIRIEIKELNFWFAYCMQQDTVSISEWWTKGK